MDAPLDLKHRSGLPDALRILIEEFPRDAWTGHQNYSQLIAFWLDRHMMFRRLLAELNGETERMLDRALDPAAYRRQLSRLCGMLINELHQHHQIEDTHFFPVLASLDKRVSTGFDLLDADHHAIDAVLVGLTDGANRALQAPPDDAAALTDTTAAFRQRLQGFAPLLNRHLVDEEELVVPVLLKYAPAALR